jgi:ribosomal protein L11 methyltransferase
VTVPSARAEEARATMLELFPAGFEEIEGADGIELVAYTDGRGEELIAQAFGGAQGADVAEDWEERWKAFHRGISIAGLWVGPPWEEPPAGATAVVIDPGRAFGTGAHPTTRVCLELLAELERGSLLDIGCGSGVLAIAGSKLGYEPVTAIDLDPQAVEAARANAIANEVVLEARLADAVGGALPAADLALANITLEAVERLGPLLASRRAVTSGYLVSEQPELDGFRIVGRRQREGWAADIWERESI